jgi:hypothetical protein
LFLTTGWNSLETRRHFNGQQIFGGHSIFENNGQHILGGHSITSYVWHPFKKIKNKTF